MKSPTFIERLEQSDIGRKLLAEEADAVLARRVEQAAEVVRLRAEWLRKAEPAIKVENAAKAKAVKANDALQAARKAWGEAQLAHASIASYHDYRIGKLERELQATASPLIAEMVTTLRAMHDEIGSRPIQASLEARMLGSRGQAGPMPEDIEKMRVEVAERDAHLERIRDSIPVVQALALEALSDEELRSRLAAIKEEAERAQAGD